VQHARLIAKGYQTDQPQRKLLFLVALAIDVIEDQPEFRGIGIL
jgi:hypothetical protein